MRFMVLLLCALFCTINLYSQQIENVDFAVEGSAIIVKYDLINCPSKTQYDLTIRFIDKNGKPVKSSSLQGDLLKVSPGTGKIIQWNYTNDIEEMATSLKVVVEITKSYSTRITGGPGNAFLSMLLPGLGDHFVNKQDKGTPYLITALFGGAIYYGLTLKSKSDVSYQAYHLANTQNDMDINYTEANENYQKYLLLMGGAAAIWLIDVIHVTVKGFKNVHEIKKKRGLAGVYILPKFSLASSNKQFQFSLIKNF